MVQRRSPPARALHCPVCDGSLQPLLLEESRGVAASCPHCAVTLLPSVAATTRRRALAGLVDFGILLVTAGPLSWLVLKVLDVDLVPNAEGIDILLQLLEQPLGLLAVRLIPFVTMATLYGLLFWWLSGQTPGQRIMGLRVVDIHGAPPSLQRAVVRALASLTGALLGFAGWLWAAFDLERRAWHDHLARTYVVRNQ